MYTYIKSAHGTPQISYNFICQLYLNEAGKKNSPFNKDINCDRVVRSSFSRPDSNIIHAISMLLLCFGGTAVKQG